jgi:sugar lactone lactonase YvrE
VIRGGVYRRDPDGRIETLVPKRRGVGGIALHADGGLVISGRDVCHVTGGRSRILLERPEGVGGFNDLCVDAAGRVLVGSLRSDPFGGDVERTPGECWRIGAEGRAQQLYGDVGLSNGLGFSPDGRILYHADTASGQVIAHDVSAAGEVSGRRSFARLPRGAPDGLCVDAEGGVWVAAWGGGCALRFAANGVLERVLEVPARQVTSVCLGGEDGRELVVVSADHSEHPERGGTIFRTRVEVAALPLAWARI